MEDMFVLLSPTPTVQLRVKDLALPLAQAFTAQELTEEARSLREHIADLEAKWHCF